jgi:DNA-binding beta-propeller fold protein YncE
MKTKFKSIIHGAFHSFGVVCAGAILLMAFSAQAQNLFVGHAQLFNGNINEITPAGVQSIFVSGLTPFGIAFNNAGNLFVADVLSGDTLNSRRAERKAPLPP